MDLVDAIEKLEAARDYIVNPDHWTKGSRWKGDQNCTLGAIERAYGATDAEPALCTAPETALAIRLLARATGNPYWEESPHQVIGSFNDSHHHWQVVEMFNRAIELAIAELVTESSSA